jgi:hypothetical protein
METLYLMVSTSEVAKNIMGDGSRIAGLLNEMAYEYDRPQLTNSMASAFRQRLDLSGRLMLEQLVAALDNSGDEA